MSRWRRGRHVFVYGFDQTYEWVGMQKHGRRRTVERHDATGMPIEIVHEVYINSIQVRARMWYVGCGGRRMWRT